MEYTGIILLLIFVVVLIVGFAGGKVKIAPTEITLDTQGFLEHLQKARLARGVTTNGGNLQMKVQGEKFVKKITSLPAGTVLWVDDHQTNNINERIALAKLGIHCECYSNNDDAIYAFDQVSPDLIISDIGRDIGSDGFALLETIRKESPNVGFIFYTLSPSLERIERARLGGANVIIEYPDQLIQEVETFIALKRFRR